MGEALAVGLLEAEDGDDSALVTDLAALVNRVYEVAEAGLWRDGATRTTPAELTALIREREIAVARRDGRLVGAVQMYDVTADSGGFGMLVSDPDERGTGVGRALIGFVERQGRERGLRAIRLELLVPRGWSHPSKEFLKAWYGRRGYRLVRTGSLGDDHPHLEPLLATECDLEIHEKVLWVTHTYTRVCKIRRMRLPSTAHGDRPWRIHAITGDFRLEDVWALPTPGGPGDFPRLVEAFTAGDPEQRAPGPVRVLWAIRWQLGKLLGWDDEASDVGARVPSLRDRLPHHLRDAPPGPEFATLPFRPLYRLDDEFAAEIANATMHGVLHVGWVEDGEGGHRGQMAVLVKPNGLRGEAYMAAIKPFRHLIVYPAMLGQLARDWNGAHAG